MKIVVIGAGLIGLTTAYFLRVRGGHEVTVLDRAEGPARETSFANGAPLTPSMAEPWNAPGCWRVLLSSIGRPDAPLQLRLRALPSLIGWGATFLRNSSFERYSRNTMSNLRLALYSLKVLELLRRETQIEYGATARGALRLFRNPKGLESALTAAELKCSEGLNFRGLTRRETVELEPALTPIADQLVGAIHYATDETGDAYSFCLALAEQAKAKGVEFSFGATVSAIEHNAGRVTALETQNKLYVADAYVVAAGSHSTLLLNHAGIRLPVRPAKGYSVTFDSPRGPRIRIPIVDDEMHAAIVPVGDSIRVAGTAEFAGYDLKLRPERVRNLVHLAQTVLPDSGLDAGAGRPWCGLRPMSADGVPLIGRTSLSNLWVSMGHGHLGWTMAAGSAQLLSDLLSGISPSIEPAPYDPQR